MKTREQLIEGLDASHAAMQSLLDEVEKNWEVYPGWTIRQVLAHLTGWDEATTASLRAYTEGSEAAIASYRGINDYNARSVETRQDLRYEQTCREWELAREALKAAILAVPDEKFGGEVLYPWGQRGSIPQLIEIFIEHDREHADEIRGLKGKAER
ncbi:MAG: maleylpyruvate isomerase N-terminal domain-containing protein [Chloroflexi bacterium]|nr:maleylpyruvate isomerase N-terminal domain-containing protein [Chloroflexota bacterium]